MLDTRVGVTDDLNNDDPNMEAKYLCYLSDSKLKSQTRKQYKKKDAEKEKKDTASSRQDESRKKTNSRLKYLQERLCGQVFAGRVDERRWVGWLNGYRDVIEVDEWEVDMNQELKDIITNTPGFHNGTKWINITPPANSPSYCLWVLFPAPPRPGHYRFTVTGVHIQQKFGLRIVVKQVEQLDQNTGQSTEMQHRGGESQSVEENENHLSGTVRPKINLTSVSEATESLFAYMNGQNKLRSLGLLVMMLVIGLATMIEKLADLCLRLMREFGNFIQSATPALKVVLDCVEGIVRVLLPCVQGVVWALLVFSEKVVGGLYLLLSMGLRTLKQPHPCNQIALQNNGRQRYLSY